MLKLINNKQPEKQTTFKKEGKKMLQANLKADLTEILAKAFANQNNKILKVIIE